MAAARALWWHACTRCMLHGQASLEAFLACVRQNRPRRCRAPSPWRTARRAWRCAAAQCAGSFEVARMSVKLEGGREVSFWGSEGACMQREGFHL